MLRFFRVLIVMSLLSVAHHRVMADTSGAFKKDIRREFFENKIADPHQSPLQRIAWIDSLTTMTGTTTVEQLMQKGMLLEDIWRNIDAYRQYLKALNIVDPDSLRQRLILNYRCARSAFHANIYDKSARYARLVLQTSKPDSLLWLDVECSTILASVAATLHQVDRMSSYVDKTAIALDRLECSEASSNCRAKARETYDIIHAALMGERGDTIGSFRILREARMRATGVKSLSLIDNNMGLVYLHNGEAEMAKRYFLDVLERHDEWHSDNGRTNFITSGRIAAAINYISVLIRQGRHEEAIEAMTRYRHELDMTANGEHEVQLHILYYNMALLGNDPKKAVDEIERAWLLNDSLRKIANSIALEEAENELFSTVNQGRTVFGGLSVALCVAIVLLVLVIVWLGVRLRRSRMDADERVADARIAGDDLGEENAELRMRIEAVDDAILPLMQMSERATADDHAIASAAREAVRSIKVKQKVWEERPHRGEGANRRFYDRLHRLNSTLTNAELKMCGYALMNMSPKDIASLTNRSIKTVNSIRHNLRRKLDIGQHETTESFMRKVSSATPDELRALADHCAGRR